MKKILIAGVALALAACQPAVAKDGFAFWSGQSLPEHQPDDAYRLEVAGWNLRVYEWTPISSPNVTCLTGFGESGPIGLQCFEKGNKHEERSEKP